VGPVEAARGLSFDAIFVPGLAEKLFPRRIVEDPILLDAARERLNGISPPRPSAGSGIVLLKFQGEAVFQTDRFARLYCKPTRDAL
jgi:hypothetical protein